MDVGGDGAVAPLQWSLVTGPFESYAQNGEDVVLMRALGGIEDGRYVDVGANDAEHFSVTYAFYRRGWRGVTVEPVPEYADRHRELRPRDTLVQAAVTDTPGTVVVHAIEGTGLSTTVDDIASGHAAHGWTTTDIEVPAVRLDDLIRDHGLADGPVHLVVVDVEGAEGHVLASIDLDAVRPWVFVVESTLPLTTEPSHGSWEHHLLEHGYTATLFDGLSRFYVADEHHAELGAALSYPACVLDDFSDEHEREMGARIASLDGTVRRLEGERDGAVAEVVRWRAAALGRWATAAAGGSASAADAAASAELERMRQTVSWKVTRPLRTVRTRLGALRR